MIGKLYLDKKTEISNAFKAVRRFLKYSKLSIKSSFKLRTICEFRKIM